jgi:hypothetical protein
LGGVLYFICDLRGCRREECTLPTVAGKTCGFALLFFSEVVFTVLIF